MYLELIIEQNSDNVFQAKCPLFPKCKGIDEDKDVAIEKLCKSISGYISRQTSSFIKEKLLSKNYTEVVVDPNNKGTFQHRVINLTKDSKDKNTHKVFLKSLSQISNIELVNNTFSSKFNFDSESVEQLESDIEEDDQLLFGISLCLN